MANLNELVLCIPRKQVPVAYRTVGGGIVNVAHDDKRFEELLDPSNVCFITRFLAEDDRNFLQIIPYNVLIVGGLIFTYKRASGAGEERLANKYSVGVGGHVSLVDAIYDNEQNALDVGLTLAECAEREMTEELLVPSFIGSRLMGILYAGDSDRVNQVHLGIVKVWYFPERHVPKVIHKDLTQGELHPLEKLVEGFDDGELELWSKHVVSDFVNNGLGQPESGSEQGLKEAYIRSLLMRPAGNA